MLSPRKDVKCHLGTAEFRWPYPWQNRDYSRRMLKKAVSKAAGESKPEAYPQGYVEDFDETRTKLADFFSILLDINGDTWP